MIADVLFGRVEIAGSLKETRPRAT